MLVLLCRWVPRWGKGEEARRHGQALRPQENLPDSGGRSGARCYLLGTG